MPLEPGAVVEPGVAGAVVEPLLEPAGAGVVAAGAGVELGGVSSALLQAVRPRAITDAAMRDLVNIQVLLIGLKHLALGIDRGEFFRETPRLRSQD